MPGLDAGSVGLNGSGKVAAAVPYSWEAAPGKPFEEVCTDSTVPVRTPLPPPPGSRGVRRPLTFVEPTFGGFEPEPHEVAKSAGPHFAEKLFKKLHTKLRKKSKVLAASFSVENIRALTEHMKRTVGGEENVQSRTFESSDERVGGFPWSTSVEQPDTPCSTDSVSLSSINSMSSSMSSLSNASTSWESISNHSALHQDCPQLVADLRSMSAASCDDDFHQDEEKAECLSGPRESAWHDEEAGEEEEVELTEREWQIVRYASLQAGDSSALISTLVRQSSLTPLSDHSYRFSPIKGRKAE